MHGNSRIDFMKINGREEGRKVRKKKPKIIMNTQRTTTEVC